MSQVRRSGGCFTSATIQVQAGRTDSPAAQAAADHVVAVTPVKTCAGAGVRFLNWADPGRRLTSSGRVGRCGADPPVAPGGLGEF